MASMRPDITIGQSPLVLAQPHGGILIPDNIKTKLNALGWEISDTDWHINKLYDGLVSNVTIVSTPVHRYVIDANRHPGGESLYPGQNTTELCPTTTFDGQSIYLPGKEPDKDEIQSRLEKYHRPYHQQLEQQLFRIHQIHGFVILYDCHSIRSRVPHLFDGRLPDFNIGTNHGNSCDSAIQDMIETACDSHQQYSRVSNGRFKGGWTTRQYGRPEAGYHAVQMELAQCNYMLESAPWTYSREKSEALRSVLREILQRLVNFG
jgi:formiminoglutamase